MSVVPFTQTNSDPMAESEERCVSEHRVTLQHKDYNTRRSLKTTKELATRLTELLLSSGYHDDSESQTHEKLEFKQCD